MLKRKSVLFFFILILFGCLFFCCFKTVDASESVGNIIYKDDVITVESESVRIVPNYSISGIPESVCAEASDFDSEFDYIVIESKKIGESSVISKRYDDVDEVMADYSGVYYIKHITYAILLDKTKIYSEYSVFNVKIEFKAISKAEILTECRFGGAYPDGVVTTNFSDIFLVDGCYMTGAGVYDVGSSQVVTFTPKKGFRIVGVYVSYIMLAHTNFEGEVYSFINVDSYPIKDFEGGLLYKDKYVSPPLHHDVVVTPIVIEINNYEVNTIVKNGNITDSNTYEEGSSVDVNFNPKDGYELDYVEISHVNSDGSSAGIVRYTSNDLKNTVNVSSTETLTGSNYHNSFLKNKTFVNVVYKEKIVVEPEPEVITYDLTTSAMGGNITKSQDVKEGSSVTVNYSSFSGYVFDNLCIVHTKSVGNKIYTSEKIYKSSDFSNGSITVDGDVISRTKSVFNNVCDDISITVTYKKVVTVLFNANGGKGSMKNQSGLMKTYFGLNKNQFKRTGYKFGGWSLGPKSAVVYKDGQRVSLSKNTVLYAKWIPLTYKVTFNKNGGKGSMSKETFSYGVSKKLSANKFKKSGYKFKGWATKKGGKVVYKNKQKIKVSKNITLYAVWKKK